jgi:hypothetical protein
MIRDSFLTVASNERPVLIIGASELNYPLPNSTTLTRAIDLQAAMDLGRGNSLVARFEVTTTFAGAGGNTGAFNVVVADADDAATIVTTGTLLVRGPTLNTAALVAGTFYELALPELSSLAIASGPNPLRGFGRRYIALCMACLATATDWTQGGVNAFLLPSSQGFSPVHHASGYSV